MRAIFFTWLVTGLLLLSCAPCANGGVIVIDSFSNPVFFVDNSDSPGQDITLVQRDVIGVSGGTRTLNAGAGGIGDSVSSVEIADDVLKVSYAPEGLSIDYGNTVSLGLSLSTSDILEIQFSSTSIAESITTTAQLLSTFGIASLTKSYSGGSTFSFPLSAMVSDDDSQALIDIASSVEAISIAIQSRGNPIWLEEIRVVPEPNGIASCLSAFISLFGLLRRTISCLGLNQASAVSQ